MNCWEFKNCMNETFQTCPAYPENGLDCWMVIGVKCDSGKIEKATLDEQVGYCRKCDYYIRHAKKF